MPPPRSGISASIPTRPTRSPCSPLPLDADPGPPPTSLREIGGIFLRLGLTSFGGPAAHIALFRDEFVRRRRRLDDAEYLDMIGVANLIPGPTSTEVAMHLGHRRAGWPGLAVAGLGFIVPAAMVVGSLAAVYVTSGSRPEVEALLAGVAPVVLAVIAHAGWSLGRAAIRGALTAGLVLGSVAASLGGVPEVLLLFGAGLAALAVGVGRRRLAGRFRGGRGAMPVLALASSPVESGEAASTVALHGPAVAASVGASVLGIFAVDGAGPGLGAILGEFLKMGGLLFGSGYVLVAFLRTELVEGLGWLTDAQLLDAIAVGQATPGPYYTTATWVGYLLGGPLGAAAATTGIFLPGFVAVAVSIPLLHRLRRSLAARAFLDGVNAAAVGLLAVVTARLALVVAAEPVSVLLALAAFLALLRGVGSGWLMAGGATLGLLGLLLADGRLGPVLG